MPKNDTITVIKSVKTMQYALVLNGLIVGVAAGAVAVVYRLLLSYAESALHWILSRVQGNIPLTILWLLGLVLLGLIVGGLVRWAPMISGSGIPQVSGEMKGYLNPSWWKVIIGKMVGGTLCIVGGLSLGREGPSVQLGAMTGKGISRLLHRVKTEEKYLISCGAGAGLAAAFNAPLAGVLFTLEEIHKYFSASALVSVMVAAVAADFVSKTVFGMTPVFNFVLQQAMPLKYYWLLIILGILIGALGALYNIMTLSGQKLYRKMTWLKPQYRQILPFLAAGILGFVMPQVLGGGHTMVELLYEQKLLIGGMLVLVVVKLLFSVFCFGSGAPGGIFFPLLVIGAYFGGIFGLFAITYLGVEPELFNNFVILAMAGFFTAIVRAPVTGIILLAEMTGSFGHLLSISLVAIVAYITAYLLRSAPIYESLLENILRNQGIEEPEDTGEKVLTLAVVQQQAEIIGKTVAEIAIPHDCLLVAVRRDGKEIIPRGDTVIQPSDTLVALVDAHRYAQIKEQLQECCSRTAQML